MRLLADGIQEFLTVRRRRPCSEYKYAHCSWPWKTGVRVHASVKPAHRRIATMRPTRSSLKHMHAVPVSRMIDTDSRRVLDALSYEGSVTAAVINSFPGTYNLVEATALTAADGNVTSGSLARLPNGQDTNNAATDWALSTTPTAGAANVPKHVQNEAEESNGFSSASGQAAPQNPMRPDGAVFLPER